MAMLGSNTVIGISRSEKVRDYVLENGGSFFRQFILVSNGVIPTRFYLRGKVERRAVVQKLKATPSRCPKIELIAGICTTTVQFSSIFCTPLVQIPYLCSRIENGKR